MGLLNTYPQIAGLHATTHEPGGEDVIAGIAPGPHEITHVQGGVDAIDSGLDARALGLVNQGDITFRAAAANTLATLGPGAAGTALLSQGAAADLVWGAPAPATHEATHVRGGTDDIDSALDARALGLTAQGEIVFHAAAATTLATLAVGGAGDALLSGGAAADISWGAPAPAAHVLATTGPHTNELPLTDLEAGAQGEIITRTAADWVALAVGGDGDALLSGGAAADISWGAPAPAAHEITHVQGGTDDIDSALDARALGLVNQGDITFLSAVANTLATLGPGGAGTALLSQGAAADLVWGAPATQPHVLDTTGPHTGTLPLTDLVVGVQGEVIIRGAADWEALGVGAALQALLSGGAGADAYWGAPTPDAHVLATTGPHSNELPLTDLVAGAQGEIITRTAADWVAFGVGTAGQSLLSGGIGADVSWGAAAPAAHEATHVKGGTDDIDSALDARGIGLSEQGSIVYHAGAANTLAELLHGTAGQALLTGGDAANPSWGAPAPAAHQGTHNDGGTDEIEIDDLPGANGVAGEIVETDGSAMAFVEPDGRYDPKAHVLATTGPHSDTLPFTDLATANRGEILQVGVADWEVLGVGTAGQSLLSGGAAANNTWGAPAPAAHEDTHVRGGSDDIDEALDARAIALTEQGSIVYHAAAGTTLAELLHGADGEALLSGGHAANPSWGAPAPAAHAASHYDGASDEIDVVNLAGTGGAAGEIVETDGNALSYVDPDGRYDPKAHVLATTGPHTDTLPLTDLAAGARGEIIARGAANWEALGVGAAGQVLQSGGAGADVSWVAPGVSVRDSQKNLELVGIGETEICAYTIDGTDRIMRVATYFRVITGETVVTVTVKYTNILAAAVTCTLVDAKALAVGDYTYAPLIFEIDASTEITLNITASVANRVFASGTIEELA